jgi:hypothetical protein
MKRVLAVPFETWLGYAAAVAGAAGLFVPTTNPLDLVLPGWAVSAFSIAYFLSGLAIVLGLLLGKPRLEVVGLVIVAASIASRQLATFGYLGWSAPIAVGVAVNVGLLLACGVRIRALATGTVVVSL